MAQRKLRQYPQRAQRICEHCGGTYGVIPSKAHLTSKWCSLACKHEAGRVSCTCGHCGAAFVVAASAVAKGQGRYCGKPCMSAAIAARRPEFDCENCGAKFTTPPSKLNAAYGVRFCTYTCCADYRKRTGETARPKSRITKCCETCKKDFIVRTSQAYARFCSNECMWVWRGPIITEKRYQPDARTDVCCGFCGTIFSALLCSIRSGRSVYCSRQCNGSASVRKQNRLSRAEKLFGDALEAAGMSPVRQHRVGRWLVDFFFPDVSLVVEFDGEYWHSTPAAIARDARKDIDMRKRGFQVLRVGERLWIERPEDAVSLVQQELTRAA